jgi:hypothetical protein
VADQANACTKESVTVGAAQLRGLSYAEGERWRSLRFARFSYASLSRRASWFSAPEMGGGGG